MIKKENGKWIIKKGKETLKFGSEQAAKDWEKSLKENKDK